MKRISIILLMAVSLFLASSCTHTKVVSPFQEIPIPALPPAEDGLGVDELIQSPETVEDIMHNMLIYEHNMVRYSEWGVAMYITLQTLNDANKEFNS